jgi:hypothetical protein
MFAVSDIDDTPARLRKHRAQLVGEVVQYENAYRLCYIRGPGLLIGLAEPLGMHRQRLASCHPSSRSCHDPSLPKHGYGADNSDGVFMLIGAPPPALSRVPGLEPGGANFNRRCYDQPLACMQNFRSLTIE